VHQGRPSLSSFSTRAISVTRRTSWMIRTWTMKSMLLAVVMVDGQISQRDLKWIWLLLVDELDARNVLEMFVLGPQGSIVNADCSKNDAIGHR